jgi:hypothetical protein
MRHGKLVLLLLLLPNLVCAAQQPLDNDAIVRMSKAGLSDTLIVTAIHTQPTRFDTSTDGMIALKAAGVSDAVVAAMVIKQAPAAAPPAAPATGVSATSPAAGGAGAVPDDPNAPHEPGVYIYSTKAQGAKMTPVDFSAYTLKKMTVGFFASYIPMAVNVRGGHSDTVTQDLDAVFYLYFGTASSGRGRLLSPFGNANSPNDLILLRFTAANGERSAPVAKLRGMVGLYQGPVQDAVVPFTSDRVAPGVFKVTTRARLKPGEYGFVPATVLGDPAQESPNSSDNRVFDFGVQ